MNARDESESADLANLQSIRPRPSPLDSKINRSTSPPTGRGQPAEPETTELLGLTMIYAHEISHVAHESQWDFRLNPSLYTCSLLRSHFVLCKCIEYRTSSCVSTRRTYHNSRATPIQLDSISLLCSRSHGDRHRTMRHDRQLVTRTYSTLVTRHDSVDTLTTHVRSE